MRVVVAAACAGVLAASGCGTGRTSGLRLSSCTIGAPAKPVAAQCGDLAVPENPFDTGGKQIPIHFAVLRATGTNPKPDPIFDFAGWGSAGVEDDSYLASALSTANVDHDLVLVDRRGTGRSNELTCTEPSDPTDTAAVSVAARRCASRIGPNLRYYTTAVAVDDFDRVRAALGYEKIDVYGESYGVTLGLVYLERHGSHVRSIALDSGSLLDVHIFERVAPNAQHALDLLFARCERDAACHDAFPHLRSEWSSLRAHVGRSPISIPDSTAKIDEPGLASAVEELLAFDKWEIPRVIHLVATGHVAQAAALAGPNLETGGWTRLAYMHVVECTEPWASRRPTEMTRLAAGTFMASSQRLSAEEQTATCKGIPRGYAPPGIGERFHSSVPVLFLQGSEDPADPPANVAGAHHDFPNSRVVVVRNSGHGQISWPCGGFVISTFFEKGSAAGLDTTCAASAAIVPFDTRR